MYPLTPTSYSTSSGFNCGNFTSGNNTRGSFIGSNNQQQFRVPLQGKHCDNQAFLGNVPFPVGLGVHSIKLPKIRIASDKDLAVEYGSLGAIAASFWPQNKRHYNLANTQTKEMVHFIGSSLSKELHIVPSFTCIYAACTDFHSVQKPKYICEVEFLWIAIWHNCFKEITCNSPRLVIDCRYSNTWQFF